MISSKYWCVLRVSDARFNFREELIKRLPLVAVEAAAALVVVIAVGVLVVVIAVGVLVVVIAVGVLVVVIAVGVLVVVIAVGVLVVIKWFPFQLWTVLHYTPILCFVF